MMKKQSIRFTPQTDLGAESFVRPQPAVTVLPDWYRAMPLHVGGDRTAGISGHDMTTPNTTGKACSPFLDGLTMGYMWTAQADIEVRHVAGEYIFRWRTPGTLVGSHSRDQHPGMPPAVGGTDFALKWECDFRVETPRGYSTLFTHPMNRHDLPFRTFTGVVDTDVYPLNVNFPFQWIGEPKEITIIPAGTPLCQIIPFRRDHWQSVEGTYDPEVVRQNRFAFLSRITRAYKSRFWHRKVFL